MTGVTSGAPVVGAGTVAPRRPWPVTPPVALGAAVLTATTLGALDRPFGTVVLASLTAALFVAVLVTGVRVLLGGHVPVTAVSAAALLSVLGVVTAERLDPGAGSVQAGALALAVSSFLVVILASASTRRWPSWTGTAAAVVACAAFALPLVPGLGHDVNGASVGVALGGVGAQLSEIARPVLAAAVAARVATTSALMRHGARPWRHLVGAVAPLAVAGVLLVLANDRGPLLVLAVTVILLVVRERPGLRVGAAVVAVPVLLAFAAFAASATLRRRFAEMSTPDAGDGLTNLGAGLRSFARGGWTGVGVGRGHPEAVRFVESDYVLTHIAEERGAVAVLAVLVLLAVVVRGGWTLVSRIDDPTRRSVAVAMVLLVAVQALYTVAGVLALVPLTGMTLPFVSRGGSALVGLWTTVGLLVGLAAHRRTVRPPRRVRGARRVTGAGFAAVALGVVMVVLVPPVAAGSTLDVDWARHRGLLLAADGTVLARTSADGTHREYPTGGLFSDVVGFTEPGAGAGLEMTERARLTCEPTWWQRLTASACDPPDLVTSLQPAAQAAARDGLLGRSGDVIAVDVASGAVLAAYSSSRGSRAADAPAFTRPSSPGSVFKLVTAAAALDNGVDTDTPVREQYVAPGGTRPVHNAGDVPGGGSLETALAESSNTAFGEIAVRVGPAGIAAAAARLLTWEPAGDLPFPVGTATIGPPPDGPDALVRTGIGQEGVRMSPLALAVLGAAVADGGVQHPPHLLAGACDGTPLPVATAPEGHRVLDGPVVERLRAAMSAAVDDGRVPALRALPGPMAAKTGTAQRPDGLTDGWLVAFTSGDRPRTAVAVRVEADPGARVSRSGGADAGPIAAAVLTAVASPRGDVAGGMCR